MKSNLLAVVTAALFSPIYACAQEAEEAATPHANWHADYDVALAKAKAENKHLLVDFTGSDWCGWCIKLDKEVFAHAEFLDPITSKFVLCALDFPRGDDALAKVPNPARNEELQQKYGVQGFPTILVLSKDEVVLGRTGYQPGGPVPYVEHLNELVTKGQQAIADVAALSAAFEKADDKSVVIGNAAAKLAEMDGDTPGVEALAKLVRHAMDLDAKKHGAVREQAIAALLTSGQADDAARELAMQIDADNGKGLLEKAIQSKFSGVNSPETAKAAIAMLGKHMEMEFKDAELGQMLFFNAARWCHHPEVLNDAEKAKPFAKRALALGAGSDDPRMKGMLEELAGGGDEEEVVEEVETPADKGGKDK